MAIIDVIRFDGLKSRDWFIYRHPVNNIVNGAWLIVQEGQLALFVKGGAVADEFEPGTYILSSENLPLLRSISKIPFGGETPYSAEVYFINTAIMLDIFWGTTDPIQLIDPKYSVKLRLRALGQMNLRAVHSRDIFKHIIGGMQPSDLVSFDRIKQYLRGMIVNKVKAVLAETIITNGVSALDISAKIEDLSDKVLEKIRPEIEEYGFECTHFYIQSINFPDEDFVRINRILEDKAAFEIMGESRYATKRSFDVYENAASNSNGVAGSFAAIGAGTGIGLNLGSSMGTLLDRTVINSRGKQCVRCHASITSDSIFCPYCGAKNESTICSNCGRTLYSEGKFCPYCGAEMEGPF